MLWIYQLHSNWLHFDNWILYTVKIKARFDLFIFKQLYLACMHAIVQFRIVRLKPSPINKSFITVQNQSLKESESSIEGGKAKYYHGHLRDWNRSDKLLWWIDILRWLKNNNGFTNNKNTHTNPGHWGARPLFNAWAILSRKYIINGSPRWEIPHSPFPSLPQLPFPAKDAAEQSDIIYGEKPRRLNICSALQPAPRTHKHTRTHCHPSSGIGDISKHLYRGL